MTKENKGFTLVELLVAIAILMIVGTALIGFFSFILNHYKKSGDETNLQYESQLLQNRIKEQILQTTHGISVEDNGTTLCLYRMDASVKKKTEYTMDAEKKQIRYQEYTLSEDGSWQSEGEAECFASLVESWLVRVYDGDGQEVTDFVNEATEPSMVTVDMALASGERTFEAQLRIALRNKIKASEDTSLLFN